MKPINTAIQCLGQSATGVAFMSLDQGRTFIKVPSQVADNEPLPQSAVEEYEERYGHCDNMVDFDIPDEGIVDGKYVCFCRATWKTEVDYEDHYYLVVYGVTSSNEARHVYRQSDIIATRSY